MFVFMGEWSGLMGGWSCLDLLAVSTTHVFVSLSTFCSLSESNLENEDWEPLQVAVRMYGGGLQCTVFDKG